VELVVAEAVEMTVTGGLPGNAENTRHGGKGNGSVELAVTLKPARCLLSASAPVAALQERPSPCENAR